MALKPTTRVLAAITAVACCSGVAAESLGKAMCSDVNGHVAPLMPYNDSAGRMMIALEYTCGIEGGPMAGALYRGLNYMEVTKDSYNLMSGNHIMRSMAGDFWVGQNVDWNVPQTIKDGQPAGWTGGGTFKVVGASPNWSKYLGKTLKWNGASTGPGKFFFEITE